jgi:hypothetical protein
VIIKKLLRRSKIVTFRDNLPSGFVIEEDVDLPETLSQLSQLLKIRQECLHDFDDINNLNKMILYKS